MSSRQGRYNLRSSRSPKKDETENESFAYRRHKRDVSSDDSDSLHEDTLKTESLAETTESNKGESESEDQLSDSSTSEESEDSKFEDFKNKKPVARKSRATFERSSKETKLKSARKTDQNIQQNKQSQKDEVPYTSLLKQISLFILISTVILYYRDSFSWSAHTGKRALITSARPVSFRYGNLTDKLHEIKQKYAGFKFGDKFWDLIVGSSWSHLEDEGAIKQPVVLMLVGQPGSSRLNEVALDIGKMFSVAFTQSNDDILHIDGAAQARKETSEAKLDMDMKLKDGFSGGGKVALISQFDQLPACSVMLFHSYCDSENAPYKDAVIIFTLQLKKKVAQHETSKDIEEKVQEHLAQAWSHCPEELTEDKIAAMHSRVSNNIALV